MEYVHEQQCPYFLGQDWVLFCFQCWVDALHPVLRWQYFSGVMIYGCSQAFQSTQSYLYRNIITFFFKEFEGNMFYKTSFHKLRSKISMISLTAYNFVLNMKITIFVCLVDDLKWSTGGKRNKCRNRRIDLILHTTGIIRFTCISSKTIWQ